MRSGARCLCPPSFLSPVKTPIYRLLVSSLPTYSPTLHPSPRIFHLWSCWFSLDSLVFMKDYMMGLLQMPKIMSSNEADRLLCSQHRYNTTTSFHQHCRHFHLFNIKPLTSQIMVSLLRRSSTFDTTWPSLSKSQSRLAGGRGPPPSRSIVLLPLDPWAKAWDKSWRCVFWINNKKMYHENIMKGSPDDMISALWGGSR